MEELDKKQKIEDSYKVIKDIVLKTLIIKEDKNYTLEERATDATALICGYIHKHFN